MESLRIGGARLYYHGEAGVVRAVDGVSLSLSKGEALGIVGESGSGKTSLGLWTMRLIPKNTALCEGRLWLRGEEVGKLNDDEFRSKVRWRRISMVFQGAMNSLNPVMRVGDQVAEPLIEAGASKPEAKEEALEKMAMVGLSKDAYYRYPHELSGGMKQRVVIAMALIMEPEVILLDEPTSALDVSVQAQIMNLLKRLKWDKGVSMIFITHDIGLASDLSDRIAVMYAGELVEEGPCEDVLKEPKHPYTKKLLASVPRVSGEREPEFIEGEPPDLSNPPAGCRFHPRCPYAFKKCTYESPLELLEGRSRVRCWLYGESQ